MKTNILFIISVFFLINAQSQTIQQYSGDFYNGTPIPGEASYSYYLENGEKIKHGSFKYTQKIRTDEGYASTTISGNFKNGFKDGGWSYTVEYKDYNSGKGNFWLTGSTRLTANYSEGIPNGFWKYSRNSKSRSKNRTVNGYSWSVYSDPIIASANAEYRKGILVNNFEMKNIVTNQYKNISGKLNGEGFCTGTWSFSSDFSEMEFVFYKNIEIQNLTRDKNTGKLTSKSNLSDEQITAVKSFANGEITSDELKNNFRIKIDTANWIKGSLIPLKSTFYSNLFLEKYIGGDKSYNDIDHVFSNIPRGVYRVYPNTNSLRVISLDELSQYKSAVSRISFSPENSLQSLNHLKDSYASNLVESDLNKLNESIKEAEEAVALNKKEAQDKNESMEIKSNISALSEEIKSNCYKITNSAMSATKIKYYPAYEKSRNLNNDYNLSRKLEKDFSELFEILSKKIRSSVDSIKSEAGISDQMTFGYDKAEMLSLEEIQKLESEILKINSSYEENLKTYIAVISKHYQIETSYIVYDKFKSSALGVDTYKTLKKPIYETYSKEFEELISSLKKSNNRATDSEIINQLAILTDRVLELKDINTKDLEKSLKKINEHQLAVKEIIK